MGGFVLDVSPGLLHLSCGWRRKGSKNEPSVIFLICILRLGCSFGWRCDEGWRVRRRGRRGTLTVVEESVLGLVEGASAIAGGTGGTAATVVGFVGWVTVEIWPGVAPGGRAISVGTD